MIVKYISPLGNYKVVMFQSTACPEWDDVFGTGIDCFYILKKKSDDSFDALRQEMSERDCCIWLYENKIISNDEKKALIAGIKIKEVA